MFQPPSVSRCKIRSAHKYDEYLWFSLNFKNILYQVPRTVCDEAQNNVETKCELVHKKVPVKVSRKVPKTVCGNNDQGFGGGVGGSFGGNGGVGGSFGGNGGVGGNAGAGGGLGANFGVNAGFDFGLNAGVKAGAGAGARAGTRSSGGVGGEVDNVEYFQDSRLN